MAVLTPLKNLAAPTALTIAQSNNINGPIGDVPGMILLAVEQTEELIILLQNIEALTDSTAPDPNLAVLTAAITNLG